MTTDNSTEVTTVQNAPSALTDDNLTDIKSFKDAMAAFETIGIAVESASDYGTGFTVVDKNRLVAVPFFVLEWRFNTSEIGETGEFVSLAVMTNRDEKWVINDGGSGLYAQMKRITARRIAAGSPTPQNGLAVPAGLVRSDYKAEDAKGNLIPATTFYLSESPTPTL